VAWDDHTRKSSLIDSQKMVVVLDGRLGWVSASSLRIISVLLVPLLEDGSAGAVLGRWWWVLQGSV